MSSSSTHSPSSRRSYASLDELGAVRFVVPASSLLGHLFMEQYRWDFDRTLIGHGEVIETGGREAFERAYGWLLAS